MSVCQNFAEGEAPYVEDSFQANLKKFVYKWFDEVNKMDK